MIRRGLLLLMGGRSHQAICLLEKELQLDGCLGVEPRSVKIASASCLHDGGRRAVPLLNYTLEFALQLKKSTENFSQGSRIVLDTTRCVDLAAL
jgi:hypothetical protein